MIFIYLLHRLDSHSSTACSFLHHRTPSRSRPRHSSPRRRRGARGARGEAEQSQAALGDPTELWRGAPRGARHRRGDQKHHRCQLKSNIRHGSFMLRTVKGARIPSLVYLLDCSPHFELSADPAPDFLHHEDYLDQKKQLGLLPVP